MMSSMMGKERDSLSAAPDSVRDMVRGPDQALTRHDVAMAMVMTELDEADDEVIVMSAHHRLMLVDCPELAVAVNVHCT